MKSLVLSILCFFLLQGLALAHPYVFELDKGTYIPIDTNNNAPDVRGKAAWANGWISSRVQLPYSFPFLSSEKSVVYYSNTGSIFLTPIQTESRIEILNSEYVFRENSYVVNRIDAKQGFFLVEYANMYLKSDTSVFVNFQCKVYKSGTIEVMVGPHNLNYQLSQEDAFYTGIDSSNFLWSYFLSGNPDKPSTYENEADSSLRTLPTSGTIYRFKYSKGNAITSSRLPEITVFPNPFASTITIDLEVDGSELDLEIMDMEGKVVWSQLDVKERTFHLEHLPPGSYLLRASSDEGLVARQVLVRN